MQGRPLIFVHIPRTGGTTFIYEVLLKTFSKDKIFLVDGKISGVPGGPWSELRDSSPDFRNSFEVVAGHMPFAADELYKQPRFATFFRNPVQRAISDYYYSQKTPANPAHQFSRELDILEFCQQGYGQLQNCHTRYLSNAVHGQKYNSDKEMLAAAIANLNRCFFIGLTERYDESVEMFHRMIGLRPRDGEIATWNSSDRPSEIAEKIQLELARYNALDIELYDHACAKFEKQLKKTT